MPCFRGLLESRPLRLTCRAVKACSAQPAANRRRSQFAILSTQSSRSGPRSVLYRALTDEFYQRVRGQNHVLLARVEAGTGPGPILRSRGQPGPHRIALDGAEHRQQMIVFLYRVASGKLWIVRCPLFRLSPFPAFTRNEISVSGSEWMRGQK